MQHCIRWIILRIRHWNTFVMPELLFYYSHVQNSMCEYSVYTASPLLHTANRHITHLLTLDADEAMIKHGPLAHLALRSVTQGSGTSWCWIMWQTHVLVLLEWCRPERGQLEEENWVNSGLSVANSKSESKHNNHLFIDQLLMPITDFIYLNLDCVFVSLRKWRWCLWW